jgi:hypothetical protein
MSRMEDDKRKRKEDEESVIFQHKLLHKDHVKNDKACKLCKHFREPNSDRYSTYCDVDGKDLSYADLVCDDFELKI